MTHVCITLIASLPSHNEYGSIRISMYVCLSARLTLSARLSVCLSVYNYAFVYEKIHNIPYHYIIVFSSLSLSLSPGFS